MSESLTRFTIRHHFRLRSPDAGSSSPTATFNRMVRSSVIEIKGTPSPNRSAFTTPPSSMERPALLSRSKGIQPLWSPQWPRSPPPSRRYLTLAVPPLRREEPAGLEDVCQSAPEAGSMEAGLAKIEMKNLNFSLF